MGSSVDAPEDEYDEAAALLLPLLAEAESPDEVHQLVAAHYPDAAPALTDTLWSLVAEHRR
jgi:hypothetical protein